MALEKGFIGRILSIPVTMTVRTDDGKYFLGMADYCPYIGKYCSAEGIVDKKYAALRIVRSAEHGSKYRLEDIDRIDGKRFNWAEDSCKGV